jgi:hypothetical protein
MRLPGEWRRAEKMIRDLSNARAYFSMIIIELRSMRLLDSLGLYHYSNSRRRC